MHTRKPYLLFVVACAVLFAAALVMLRANQRAHEDAHIQTRLSLMTDRLAATVANLQTFSHYAFEKSINVPEVTSLLAEARDASPLEQGVLRERLLQRMHPDYERLIQYNFRQIQFVFPDSVSFLRVNSPNDFGDNLSDVRATFKRANETLKPVYGFEEGRTVSGYRFVYPLFHQGRHCGAVEVSFSMASFIEVLHNLSPSNYRFAMARSVVESTVFQHRRSDYLETPFSPLLLYDKDVKGREGTEAVFAAIGSHLDGQRLEARDDFGFMATLGDQDCLVLFKTIENFRREKVAYVVSTVKDPEYVGMVRANRVALGLVAAGFLAVFVLGWIVIADRQKLQLLSSTDLLTQVFNRIAFAQFAEQELERARRYAIPVSLLMIDGDDFKSINDRFGHNEGDRVLRSIAAVLRAHLRSTDCLARWGGEEFVAMLPHASLAEARVVGEKLCKTIAGAPISKHCAVTISVGVAELRNDDGLDRLIERADAALYRAKKSGKNRTEVEERIQDGGLSGDTR